MTRDIDSPDYSDFSCDSGRDTPAERELDRIRPVGASVASAEQLDRIGRASDSLDNGLAALRLPGLPASLHIEGLSGIMREVRDELRKVYVEVSGEDPWEESR